MVQRACLAALDSVPGIYQCNWQGCLSGEKGGAPPLNALRLRANGDTQAANVLVAQATPFGSRFGVALFLF
jgi:hypothetical protein